MLCGHCEAFCPQQALVLDYLREEKLSYEEEDSRVAPENLSLYMRKRRSIRHFKPEPVDKDTIGKILEIARYAPSGGNSQTVQWLVIYDTEEVKRIASLTVEWMRSIQGTPHPLSPYVAHIIRGWDLGFDPICCKATTAPKTNVEYWTRKFEQNVKRDADNVIALQNLGWRVAILWECAIKDNKSDLSVVAASVLMWLKSREKHFSYP